LQATNEGRRQWTIWWSCWKHTGIVVGKLKTAVSPLEPPWSVGTLLAGKLLIDCQRRTISWSTSFSGTVLYNITVLSPSCKGRVDLLHDLLVADSPSLDETSISHNFVWQPILWGFVGNLLFPSTFT